MFNFPHFEGKIGVNNTRMHSKIPELDIAC
jgi:hypothetical protein